MPKIVVSHLSSSETVEIDALASFASMWAAAVEVLKLPENSVGHIERITTHQPFLIENDVELCEDLSRAEDPSSILEFRLTLQRSGSRPSSPGSDSSWVDVEDSARAALGENATDTSAPDASEAVAEQEDAAGEAEGEGASGESDTPRHQRGCKHLVCRGCKRFVGLPLPSVPLPSPAAAGAAPLGVEEVVAIVDQSEVVVSLDVGGESVHTPLATVMEGVRQGGEEFKKLCGKLLGGGWEGYEAGGAVPAEVAARAEGGKPAFVDIDPRVFAFVLEYLRSGELPSGSTRMLENVRAWATRTGMQALQRACQDSFKRLDTGMVAQLMNGQMNLAGMDMRRLDLSGMSLDGARLTRAKLNNADLQNASLAGAFANDADFSGADLTGANFEGVTLLRAKLVGAKADGAVFCKAKLDGADSLAGAFANDADFSGADLTGANFEGVTLLRAKLVGAKADGAVFCKAKLDGADLSGGSFVSANFSGGFGETSFQGAKLDRVNAESADFSGAFLSSTSFVGANLARSNLSSANFYQTNVDGANLSGCNFTGAYFHGVLGLATATFDNLCGAKLEGVDFNGVDLGGKDCTGANFQGTNLLEVLNLHTAIGADLHGAQYYDQSGVMH